MQLISVLTVDRMCHLYGPHNVQWDIDLSLAIHCKFSQ